MAPRQCLALFFALLFLPNLPLALGQVRRSTSRSGTDLTISTTTTTTTTTSTTASTPSSTTTNATITIVEVTIFVGIMEPASASVKSRLLPTQPPAPAPPFTSDLEEGTWTDIKHLEEKKEQWMKENRAVGAYNAAMLLLEILARF